MLDANIMKQKPKILLILSLISVAAPRYVTNHTLQTGARGGAFGLSGKVAGSIPDGVIGIFQRHSPFGRTIALGMTQSLRQMSTHRPP